VTDASEASLTISGETFEEFYGRSWPGVVRLAGLLTQEARSAEDLAQEALQGCFRSGRGSRTHALWPEGARDGNRRRGAERARIGRDQN
jgi:DNA-directed RNA polymerase specialized sigma24 family protein